MAKLSRMITTAALAVAGVLAAAPHAVAGNTVWVFDQTNANIKPCFKFSNAGGWKDFGGIAAQGQFAWGDFLTIVQAELGLADTPTEATVRFTSVPTTGTCPAPGVKVHGKTVFEVDAQTNVYILVGGHAEVRVLGGERNRDDDDRDGDKD